MKKRPLALVTLPLLLLACGGRQALQPDPPSSLLAPAPVKESPPSLAFFNVTTGRLDPRFETVPREIARVELTPEVTLQALVAPGIQSVRFVVDGVAHLDTKAPFFLTEEQNRAVPWDFALGKHTIQIDAFPAPDGSGAASSTHTATLSVTGVGLDPTPNSGEHSVHQFWVTESKKYVSRSPEGDFIGPAGEVVLAKEDVELQEPEKEQGRYVTIKDGADSLAFAFEVLLPEGFEEGVQYPLVLFLHHGWDVFRGTDNDGRVRAESPLFDGPRSLICSPLRNQYPAVILIPQMIRKEEREGVSLEWAAFSDLDPETGRMELAANPAPSAAFALRALEDLVSGVLRVKGHRVGVDPARLYLTGHSMGGLGTWDLIARRPGFFAAAVPMAGYSDWSTAKSLVAQPIWAFHHRRDCYNTEAGTAEMVRRIRNAAGSASVIKWTVLDFDTDGKCDQAHFQTPAHAWQEPGIMTWLFSQTRAPDDP